MPCDQYVDVDAIERNRLMAERIEAMNELDRRLVFGTASVAKGLDGSFTIEGWDSSKVDMTDLCALADIAMHGSFAARMTIETVTQGAVDFAALHAEGHR